MSDTTITRRRALGAGALIAIGAVAAAFAPTLPAVAEAAPLPPAAAVDPIALQAEADRRVAAATIAFVRAAGDGPPDRAAVLTLAAALLEVRDDLEGRHGEVGRRAFLSALATATEVMERGLAPRPA